MATKKELTYNLLNLLESGRVTDDFIPSYAQISFIIDYKRAQYIKQDQNKNYFDNDQFYQDLGVIPMELVDKSECPNIPLDCNVLRSTLEIPALLRLDNRLALKISAIDKQSRFTIILPERTPFLGNTKYNQIGIKTYWLNNRIYIPETYDIKAINVRGILQDPNKAKSFICNGSACFTDDMEYPITTDMYDLIVKDVTKNEFVFLLPKNTDQENDTQNKPQE